MEHTFDAIIVGAGQAGPPLAGRLTAAGWKVALVERKLIGGTCVNTGCTPTKAMVASARVAYTAAHADAFGVDAGPVRTDMRQVKARKDAIVAKSRNGNEDWLSNMEGLTLFRGAAHFVAPGQLAVGDDTLTAKHIFLNVGARPRIPDFPGVPDVPYLTSSTILELEDVPEHLIIVGGSYVGLEFAQIFRRFGAQVTVVERAPRLLGQEDDDTCDAVREALEAEGIRFRLHAECIALKGEAGNISVHVDCHDGVPAETGTHVLLAVGRVPNTDDLGVQAAGLKVNAQGYLETDDQLRTSVEGIWALGDCNGRGAFTHTAYNDFEIVAANLLDHDPRRVTDRIPVSALYTDPPVGRVGMNERQVRATGKPALMGVRPMTRVGRAIEKGETRGFMKVLVDAETEAILGATVIGVGGDEAIHSVLAMMYAKQPAATMRRSVFIHPTVAELLPTVFGELKPLG